MCISLILSGVEHVFVCLRVQTLTSFHLQARIWVRAELSANSRPAGQRLSLGASRSWRGGPERSPGPEEADLAGPRSAALPLRRGEDCRGSAPQRGQPAALPAVSPPVTALDQGTERRGSCSDAFCYQIAWQEHTQPASTAAQTGLGARLGAEL